MFVFVLLSVCLFVCMFDVRVGFGDKGFLFRRVWGVVFCFGVVIYGFFCCDNISFVIVGVLYIFRVVVRVGGIFICVCGFFRLFCWNLGVCGSGCENRSK